MGKKEVVLLHDLGDMAIYVRKGAKPGDPGVRVEWQFSTGSTLGPHSYFEKEAEIESGILDEDMQFESKENWLFHAEGFDMPRDKHEETDWDSFYALVVKFFEEKKI